MLTGIYILGEASYNKIYGQAERDDISALVQIKGQYDASAIQANLALLADVDFIFSGWGGPKLDEEFLAAAPNLKAVFYGSGTIKRLVTEEFWQKNIPITSAYAANAIPVAEFTLAEIIFSLKRGWHYAFSIKREGKYFKKGAVPGAFGTTVGLISLGMIGRYVCKLLKCLDVNIIAYDPFISKEVAADLGVTLCTLPEVFQQSDVVSLHTPWLKETENMITGELFASMKNEATFINTARGAVVNETEMIEVLKKRPDLYAVLDVTYPEPPVPDSPLYTLPNVIITPHIAGSMNRECERMGRYMVNELQLFLANKPLEWEISQAQAALLA